MLWLPTAQTRKTMARLKRLRRRRLFARVLLFLFIFFGLRFAAAPPAQALLVQVDAVTTGYQFDFVNWESLAVADEIGRRWHSPPLPAGDAEQRALVEKFLELEQLIRDLEGQLDQIYAANSNPATDARP
ncbi:MAG: hypothetical protein EHM12_13020, partial [Dehalococcoidia bacterium]